MTDGETNSEILNRDAFLGSSGSCSVSKSGSYMIGIVFITIVLTNHSQLRIITFFADKGSVWVGLNGNNLSLLHMMPAQVTSLELEDSLWDGAFTHLGSWCWLSVPLHMEQVALPHSMVSRFQSKCPGSQKVETDSFLRPEAGNQDSITFDVFYRSDSHRAQVRMEGSKTHLSVRSVNKFCSHVFKLR